MVFASAVFLFLFFPIVLGVYFLINPRLRNTWLCLASFVFYAWGGLSYALLILISTSINYLFGLYIGDESHKGRKQALILSVIYNLGILGFFKYFNFSADIIQSLLRMINPNFTLSAPLIPLPIGISFFTFQIMSYVIDLYRRETKVQKNIISLGLYIMLFPQLIAGPIVRYIDVEKEIQDRQLTVEGVRGGLKRFTVGLSKKVFFANAMGEWADYAFNNMLMLNTETAWLGIIGYTLQIYFDFSAYSDMAIGLGQMFGFHFLENFNYPYIAKSMQDFWRRWHISLTEWFRDYLYIPLGGNRKGTVRTYINNLIVFLCTGLWHGASWNFIVWGMYHGFFLIIEKTKIGACIKKMASPVGHLYTMLIVMIGWVFFRADNLRNAVAYLKCMFFNIGGNKEYFYFALDPWKIWMLILSVVFCFPIGKHIERWVSSKGNKGIVALDMVYLIMFLVSIMFVAGASFNPFIYFRF